MVGKGKLRAIRIHLRFLENRSVDLWPRIQTKFVAHVPLLRVHPRSPTCHPCQMARRATRRRRELVSLPLVLMPLEVEAEEARDSWLSGIYTGVIPPRKTKHRYQKWWFGRCISFQIWLFWVFMLVFGDYTTQLNMVYRGSGFHMMMFNIWIMVFFYEPDMGW